MTSRLIPEHFKKDGTPKNKFNKDDADQLAQHHKVDSYECTFCGFWHLGNKEKNV